MDRNLKGAWILNLGKKVSSLDKAVKFDGLMDSSKIGCFLQVLCSDDTNFVNRISIDEVKTKSKLIGINNREMLSIIEELKSLNLLDTDSAKTEVELLGLTNYSILQHTTEHFEKYNSEDESEILIETSEKITNVPEKQNETVEELSDTFRIVRDDVEKYINCAIDYGLIDKDENSDYLYNGNIFRFDEIEKNKKILDSFSDNEKRKLLELQEELSTKKCLDYGYCKNKYTENLIDKLIKVNLVDPNEVNSPNGKAVFLTSPGSFKRFADNAFIDDVMDFAKAFLSSIYYGMTKSYTGRGKIDGYYFLLKKLLRGEPVGPATAICQDYVYLETRGVVKIEKAQGYGCYMTLLKKEIGQLVLDLLENGIITGAEIEQDKIDCSFDVSDYKGPEVAKKTLVSNKTVITDMLESIRKG